MTNLRAVDRDARSCQRSGPGDFSEFPLHRRSAHRAKAAQLIDLLRAYPSVAANEAAVRRLGPAR